MEKLILLKNPEVREKLSSTFKCTQANISQSLTFSRNGEKNVRIRVAAMRNGGVLMLEVPEWNVSLLK